MAMPKNKIPPRVGKAFKKYHQLVLEGLVCDDPVATREAFREAGMQIVLDLIEAYEPGMDPYEFCTDFDLDEIRLCAESKELRRLLGTIESTAESTARHRFKHRTRINARKRAAKRSARARISHAQSA